MTFLLMFLIFLFPISASAGMYTVQKNDSLWKIAQAHKISISDIRKLNDLYQDSVYINQKLYVPSLISNYTVLSTDTFQSIAKKFNTKISYIVTLNNLSENQAIEGQKLRIPVINSEIVTATSTKTVPVVSTKPLMYKVRKGDTLSDVALKYRTTVPKLKELNNKNSNSIYAGEQLVVGKVVLDSSQNNSKNLNNTENVDQKIIHQVRTGETLGKIAIKYRVSSQQIMNWNKKSSSRIYANEKLVVYPPDSNVLNSNINKSLKENNPNYKKIQYKVRRGENLSTIALKFKSSPSEIKRFNNKKTDRLLVGESLNIYVKATPNLPKNTSSQANTKMIRYKVKRGDTLDGIAIKYRVNRSQLLSWNNKRSTQINIGETLKIHTRISSVTTTSTSPKTSKKAEYIKRNSGVGIKSNKFNNVPLPVKSANIISASTSGRGVELLLNKKENILSPINAKVQYAGYINALQNVVILQLTQNRTIVYAGLDRINVKTGQEITKGFLLGSTGINKIDNQPKIYMEMRDNNNVVNALHSYKELSKKVKK